MGGRSKKKPNRSVPRKGPRKRELEQALGFVLDNANVDETQIRRQTKSLKKENGRAALSAMKAKQREDNGESPFSSSAITAEEEVRRYEHTYKRENQRDKTIRKNGPRLSGLRTKNLANKRTISGLKIALQPSRRKT